MVETGIGVERAVGDLDHVDSTVGDLDHVDSTVGELNHVDSTVLTWLQQGVGVDDIVTRVRLVLENWEVRHRKQPPQIPEDGFTLSRNGQEKIFYNLPEGMIDIATAAKRYGRPIRTIRGWIQTGALEAQGRLRSQAPGGGTFIVLQEDLLKFVLAPINKGGRRPKKAEHV